MATLQEGSGHERLSSWDFFYSMDMAITCFISYSIITYFLSPFVRTPDGSAFRKVIA